MKSGQTNRRSAWFRKRPAMVCLAVLSLLAAACADLGAEDVGSSPDQNAGAPRTGEQLELGSTSSALSLPPAQWPVVLVQYQHTTGGFNAAPAGRTPASGQNAYTDLFFGSAFPTVNGYFTTISGGAFRLTHAGTYLVVENTALDAAAGVTPEMAASSDPEVQEVVAARRLVYYLGQAGFNFAARDVRAPIGSITPDELGIVVVQQDTGGGANRPGHCVPTPNNGPKFCTDIAFVGDDSEFMNYPHELAHTLGMLDVYGFWSKTCYGDRVSMASCTAGGGNRSRLYYPDPFHRIGFGWNRSWREVVVTAANSGSQRLRPVSRDIAVSGSAHDLLVLSKGQESYAFEVRKRDTRYERDVAVEGVIAWYMKRDSAGNLQRTRFTDPNSETYWNADIGAYEVPREWAHYPVPPDRCHLDELYGRNVTLSLPANQSFRLRSEKTPWNIAVSVSAPDAQGAVTVSWGPAADDNSCASHQAQNSSFVVARMSSSMDVVRAPSGSAVATDSTWAGSTWSKRLLPAAPDSLRPISVISKSPTTLDAFAVDRVGRILHATFNGSSWSTWSALTSSNEVAPEMQLAAVSRRRDHLDIFYVTRAGALKTMFNANGAGWEAA